MTANTLPSYNKILRDCFREITNKLYVHFYLIRASGLDYVDAEEYQRIKRRLDYFVDNYDVMVDVIVENAPYREYSHSAAKWILESVKAIEMANIKSKDSNLKVLIEAMQRLKEFQRDFSLDSFKKDPEVMFAFYRWNTFMEYLLMDTRYSQVWTSEPSRESIIKWESAVLDLPKDVSKAI